MSTSLIDPAPAADDVAAAPATSSLVPKPRKNSPAEWLARMAIIALAGGLAWYTWGHWGDFQIDCGRELYVPAAILHGKLLFRDLWYPYGPLAPYLNALFFWIFGVRLTVLYVFGLVLTMGTALVIFEVARQFNLGIVGSMAPPLFFLTESFYPFIRNFIFPYTYAASLAAFLGVAFLYFAIRHATTMRRSQLVVAAFLTGLALLAKQEFGVACLVVLAFEIGAAYLIRRSSRALFRDVVGCLAGLTPALAVYAWFTWKVSARGLFFENWALIPGSYFLASVGRRFMADQGFRVVPAELLEVAEYAVLAIAIWYILASLNALVIEKLQLRSRFSMALPPILSVLPLAITCLALVRHAPQGMVVDTHLLARSLWDSLPPRLLAEAIFPTGIFLLVVCYFLYAAIQLFRAPSKSFVVQDMAVGLYAALVGLRQMMELEPTLYKCAVFFNVPAFLIFVIVLHRVIRWAARSLDMQRRDFLTAGLLAAETLFLLLLFFPKPQMLPARLTTAYGTFYTRYDVARLYPQIVSFMQAHTKNGKDILVIPEPPSLYVFAGVEAPTPWHQLTPGVLAPELEPRYINDLKSNDVRYILIANREFPEYGVSGFLENGYNHGIYRWVMANFTRVDQFGPLANMAGSGDPFIMSVYERKDLEARVSGN